MDGVDCAADGRYAARIFAVLVGSIGWPRFFLVSTAVALPALWMLWRLRDSIRALDVDPATAGATDD